MPLITTTILPGQEFIETKNNFLRNSLENSLENPYS